MYNSSYRPYELTARVNVVQSGVIARV